MSFYIDCPTCGPRPVTEYVFGGPVRARPEAAAPQNEWVSYLYYRENPAGEQSEWWYHSSACKQWFIARRDLRTNAAVATSIPADEGPQRAD